jgi:hypothetical protein
MRFQRVGTYYSLDFAGFHFAVHSRSHSPQVIIGLVWHCRNGLQLLVGPAALTICWPSRFGRRVVAL